MSIRRTLALSLVTVFSALLFAVDGLSYSADTTLPWTLVWNDEFTGPAGQSPASSKWGYDIGTDWGNAQLEYDTDRPSNVSLDGSGHLAITAREEYYMGQPYTSARIVTRDRYEPTYGRVEARIKLPVGQGIWPAFWLLGSDFASVGWPECGEIDIMEFLGHETNTIHGTIHGPGYSGGGGIGQSYTLDSGQFNTGFHIFAIEWEEDVIRWYVDTALYQTLTPADLEGNEWVFDHPFYIILNVAVGGNWPGPPDGTTVFPQTMLIDYVRVYQRGAGELCCSIRGDIDHNGAGPDISDLVYLVDYMFNTGNPPLCPEEADVNNDGVGPDISDLVFLVSYMFGSGEAPAECPDLPIYDFVFTDEFNTNVFYQPFAWSKPDAVQTDPDTVFAGVQGLAITIPDPEDPEGGYAGGAFTCTFAHDLTAFNALTFWARASTNATLDVVGIGNDNTGTSRFTADVTDYPLTTTWQKYVIPFPLPGKLNDEQGLFFFAEGPENGNGYQIWMDEIIFEDLATITNPRPALTTQTIDVELGDTIDIANGTVTFDVDGADVAVNTMPGYFDFTASNETVVSVQGDGTIVAAGAGSATLTATLGGTPATGVIAVNVTAPPDEPSTPAPTPTADPGDVISLFSDVYTGHPVDTWSAAWDMADVEDYLIGSDSTRKYTNLIFAGIEFTTTTVDASSMTHFHIDVWTPDPTGAPAVFKIKLVDFGADGVWDGGANDDVEHEITLDESTMNTGSWVSMDLPLADFTNLTTREHLAQLIISGDPNTVYVDNVYFHK